MTGCNCGDAPIFGENHNKVLDSKCFDGHVRKGSFKTNSFVFHLGVLIFAPYLEKLIDNGLGFVRQFLVAILLGAQNIEQSKMLNHKSMGTLIGKSLKSPYNQRKLLKSIALPGNTDKILAFNIKITGGGNCRDFYYDPHTKHYTGQLKTLSTWCPSVRLADKGINMDFIHTVNGMPVYFNSDDNFYDLRERFFPTVSAFRKIAGIEENSPLTIIIDRGIYSIEVFEKVTASPNTHIITWEKGYEKDKWDNAAPIKTGQIQKLRNHHRDVKLVHYRYQESDWDKNPDMRRIIVRVMDKNWDTLIEVSIITDDRHRDAGEITWLMLKRWVQENDFKYLIKHFGINQITTYAFTDYKELKDKIEDKVYICNEHKSLTKEIHRVRAKLKTALLRKHNVEIKIHTAPNDTKKQEQQQALEKVSERVKKLSDELKTLEEKRRATPKYTSKIEALIEENYQKLDVNIKRFMDAIKILARNIFYLSFAKFKDNYDNYRDDHVIFRHLSRSHGFIENRAGKARVKLMPEMEFAPKVKKAVEQTIAELNEMEPKIPNGTNQKFDTSLLG